MKLRSLFDRLVRRADASYHDLFPRGGVVTLVSVVTKTAPQTFTGSAVLVTVTPASDSDSGSSVVAGGAVAATRSESSPSTTDSQDSSETADSSAAATTAAAATSSESAATSSASSVFSPNDATTSPPVTVAPSSTIGAGAVSQSSATRAAATTSTTDNKGMTGGAKAGLAFGIIALIGLALVGVLLLYRRKKQQTEAHERLDDEKAAMAKPDMLPSHPTPVSVPPPTSRSQTSTVTAPQLSLRPVTQFDPRMSSVGPNSAAPAAAVGLAAGAAAGAAAAKSGSSSPKSGSAWEKSGAERHANDPTNPFGNHAETVNGSPPKDAVVGATLGAGAQPRPISGGHIDAADFPLPASGPPSPKPLSLKSEASSAGYSSSGASTIAATPTTTVPQSLQVGEAAAGAAAGAAIGGGAAAAAASGTSKPAGPGADNVHRVQLDFKPSMEDELEIRAGQLVRMLHEYDDGWVSTKLTF
jgi:hypothetical protein